MADNPEYVTIFRSAEMAAEDEANAVCATLAQGGIDAVILDDDAPGVVEGTYEVRVRASDAGAAEALLASSPAEPPADPSHDLDLVTVFESQTANAEIEALSIKSILDANNIDNVLVEVSSLPNLPHVVKVPKDSVDEANRVIAEARAMGPAAAEEEAIAAARPGSPETEPAP